MTVIDKVYRVFIIVIMLQILEEDRTTGGNMEKEDMSKITTRSGQLVQHFEIITAEASVTERKDNLEKEFAILVSENLVTNRRNTEDTGHWHIPTKRSQNDLCYL